MFRSIRSVLKRPGWRGALLGLCCAVAAWGLTRWPPFGNLEEWLRDAAFSFRGDRFSRGKAKVVIIGLDDDSLNHLKKPLIYISPQIAEVVHFLKSNGAAAIGLDLIIPDSLKSLPALELDGEGDATKLGDAIEKAGNVVLAKWLVKDTWLQSLPQWRYKTLLEPALTDSGFVNLTEDDDTFVRQQVLITVDESTGPPSAIHFALALFAQAHRVKDIAWNHANQTLSLDGEIIPLDDEKRLRINFVGPPDTFPVVPLKEVLDKAKANKAWPELNGSIVIIGVTARSQQDYHATPYANNYSRSLYDARAAQLMSGSEIHANIIATLYDRAYITSLPPAVSLGILLLLGAVLGRTFAMLSVTWGFAIAVGHHFLWKYLCLASLAYLNYRLESVAMFALGALVFGVTFIQRWWTLRQMLGVVKSEAIARLLENDPGQFDQRGEERIVTVLFADIRNFTDFSDKHGPRQVVALLNAYFTAIVPIIEEHGGTLNQYMGDGIMVIYGLPTFHPDHVLQAVRTAVEIVKRVHELKEQWAELGSNNFRIGVGIHTGPVVAGAVGSPRRLDYTAIGDAVNVAARIESQNKEFGTEILISSDTFRDVLLKDRRALGCAEEGKPVVVKGKPQPLMVHAVSVGNG